MGGKRIKRILNSALHTLYPIPYTPRRGFTLVETLAAVSLLSIAIVAPMILTMQSISSAYYARDQITAFYLAQEAIEAVHSIRDGQILQIAQNGDPGTDINLFGDISSYADNHPFTIDGRDNTAYDNCTDWSMPPFYGCPVLQTDDTLYGYDASWKNTIFTRVVRACYVQPDGSCSISASDTSDTMRITVSVVWKTGSFNQKTFTISEDLYRWVRDGSGV